MKINPILKDIIEWIICIIIAVVIALLVRYYIGTPTVVESVSMEPTLYAHQGYGLIGGEEQQKKCLKEAK